MSIGASLRLLSATVIDTFMTAKHRSLLQRDWQDSSWRTREWRHLESDERADDAVVEDVRWQGC